MAEAAKSVEKQLREMTECPICMNAFTDPRMLPCIHTFCFQCLKRTAEAQKKPRDKMTCPLCRKEFTIPQEGIVGLQRNFFMENFLEFKTILQNNDPILKIGRETNEEVKRMTEMKFCTKHTQKPLDCYCADCKKTVCVSCFVSSHKLHDCKDVTTVDEEFRHTIEKKAWKISNFRDEMLSIRKITEKRQAEFVKKLMEEENEIDKRSQELKAIIEKNTKSLLNELSAIKSYRLKEFGIEMEDIDRCCTILGSFQAYCTDLRSKGSASDICSSIDELLFRADDLEKTHETLLGGPRHKVVVSFLTSDFKDDLQRFNNNIVGQIKAETETTSWSENCAIVVGLNVGPIITREVVKINLHRPKEISTQEQIPTAMATEAVAAVYCNTMYVNGIGVNEDEIWKYKEASGWMKCASLGEGRRRHSAAFIDEVLYICGGFVDSQQSVIDSVEAYNTVTNKCNPVGKLVHRVQGSGNCVPYKCSLYIFGGSDKDNNAFSHVQVYNTKQNTCTLLSKPMPHPSMLMRSALYETSVILLGGDTCFIFNFETEKWQEREKFKTNVVYFALVLDNDRVFVIGGGTYETGKDGIVIWKCRDDIRSVPLQNIIKKKPIEWKIHGKLPKPCLVHACANIRFPVYSRK